MGRSYKLQHIGPKALSVVQPKSRGCEPLKGPGDLHSHHPSCTQPVACRHLLLALLSHYQAPCQAEEGTVPKHLYLSLDSFSVQEYFAVFIFTSLRALLSTLVTIFRKSDCIVVSTCTGFHWMDASRKQKC